MHTDSLLDFLHIYTSPALLFNLQGELLYANAAAELCHGGEISTEAQAQSAIFKQHQHQQLPSFTPPEEIQTSIYVKVQAEAEEFNFRFQTPATSSSASTSTSSLSRSSSSRPSSSSSTARPPSSSSASGRGSRPASAKRKSRPNSRSGSILNNNSNGGSGTATGTEWQQHDGEEDYNGGDEEDYPTPTGFTTERRQLHWKVTKTKCKRVVALAQEKSSSFSVATVPTTCTKEQEVQKDITPVIRTPWQRQPRFEPMKQGGGEMGEKVRAYDWDNHPLGGIGSWPQARVEMVGLVLRSPVPMTAYLEDEAYVVYNDAYIAVLGQTKHRSGGELTFSCTPTRFAPGPRKFDPSTNTSILACFSAPSPR